MSGVRNSWLNREKKSRCSWCDRRRASACWRACSASFAFEREVQRVGGVPQQRHCILGEAHHRPAGDQHRLAARDVKRSGNHLAVAIRFGSFRFKV